MMMMKYKTNKRHECVTLIRFIKYDADDNDDDKGLKRIRVTSLLHLLA